MRLTNPRGRPSKRQAAPKQGCSECASDCITTQQRALSSAKSLLQNLTKLGCVSAAGSHKPGKRCYR